MNDLALLFKLAIVLIIGGGCLWIMWNNPDA